MIGFTTAGALLVLGGLALLLLRAHWKRIPAWDRPRWTLRRLYGAVAGPAAISAVAVGTLLLFRAGRAAGSAAVALLAGLWLWTRWAASARSYRRVFSRQFQVLRTKHPTAPDSELLLRLAERRHPQWDRGLLERMVEDSPTPEALARVLLRMERMGG